MDTQLMKKSHYNILISVVAVLSIAVLYLLYDKFYNKNTISQKFSGIPSSYVDVLGGNIQPTPSPGNVSLVYSADTSGNLVTLNTMPLIPQGTIVAFNGPTAPVGWVLCDGKIYDKTTGVVATTVGSNTIIAPDLRGRFVLGSNSSGTGASSMTAGLTTTNSWLASGRTGGEERVTLTEDEMPRHTHASLGNTSYQTGSSYDGLRVGNYFGRFGNSFQPESSYFAGKSQSHNNMPPYYVLTYIMKL